MYGIIIEVSNLNSFIEMTFIKYKQGKVFEQNWGFIHK